MLNLRAVFDTVAAIAATLRQLFSRVVAYLVAIARSSAVGQPLDLLEATFVKFQAWPQRLGDAVQHPLREAPSLQPRAPSV